jgi:hypothetical protein
MKVPNQDSLRNAGYLTILKAMKEKGIDNEIIKNTIATFLSEGKDHGLVMKYNPLMHLFYNLYKPNQKWIELTEIFIDELQKGHNVLELDRESGELNQFVKIIVDCVAEINGLLSRENLKSKMSHIESEIQRMDRGSGRYDTEQKAKEASDKWDQLHLDVKKLYRQEKIYQQLLSLTAERDKDRENFLSIVDLDRYWNRIRKIYQDFNPDKQTLGDVAKALLEEMLNIEYNYVLDLTNWANEEYKPRLPKGTVIKVQAQNFNIKVWLMDTVNGTTGIQVVVIDDSTKSEKDNIRDAIESIINQIGEKK